MRWKALLLYSGYFSAFCRCVSTMIQVDFSLKNNFSVVARARERGSDLGKERKLQCAGTLVADTQTASLKCLHGHSQLHTFSVSAAPNCPKFG